MTEEVRHIYGIVDASGHAITQVGYTVDKAVNTNGLYDITFDQPFQFSPSVTATQLYPDETDSTGGNTLDNAVLVYVRNDRCRIKTGDSSGTATNRSFCFTAVGQ